MGPMEFMYMKNSLHQSRCEVTSCAEAFPLFVRRLNVNVLNRARGHLGVSALAM